MAMKYSVKDIFDSAPELFPVELVSPAMSFYQEYVRYSSSLNRRFLRLYKNFKYFEECDSPLEAYYNLMNDVRDYCIANKRRLEELFRVEQIDDDKYSLYNNYDVTETMDRDTTAHIGNQEGEAINDIGGRSDSSSHSVAPYDEDLTHIKDGNSHTYGSQTNITNTNLGERNDSGTEDFIDHKVGNIGVQTVSDMLEKHKKFWTNWKFWDYLFEQYAKEFLLVD